MKSKHQLKTKITAITKKVRKSHSKIISGKILTRFLLQGKTKNTKAFKQWNEDTRETKTFHDMKYNLLSEVFTDMSACQLVISSLLCVTLEPESGMQ